MDTRGQAIPVKDWWLNLARRVVSTDTRDYRTLGKELARHVKRPSPFNHGMLSRFATGVSDPRSGKPIGVTFELALALCAEYRSLPLPVFFPRSYEEAVHIRTVSERYDSADDAPNDDASIISLPDNRRRKRRALDEAATSATPSKRRAAR